MAHRLFRALLKLLPVELRDDYGREMETTFRAARPETLRLAAAAILYHVIAADGVVSDEERETLRAVLRDQYDLGDEDAAALLDRAREADLQAVDFYGFTSTLLSVLSILKPTHLAVALDAPGKTFRHEKAEEYKATRAPMPEELVTRYPMLEGKVATLPPARLFG